MSRASSFGAGLLQALTAPFLDPFGLKARRQGQDQAGAAESAPEVPAAPAAEAAAPTQPAASPPVATGAQPVNMVPSIQGPTGTPITNPLYANGGLRPDAAAYAQTLGLPAGAALPYWTTQGIPWNVNSKSFVDPGSFATSSTGGLDTDYYNLLRADFEKSRRGDLRQGGLDLLDRYAGGGIWSAEDQAALLELTGRLSPEAAANLQDQFSQARNVTGALPEGVTYLGPMSESDWRTALGEDLYKQYAPLLPVIPAEFDTTPGGGSATGGTGSFLDQLHEALGDTGYNNLLMGSMGLGAGTNPQSAQASADLMAALMGLSGFNGQVREDQAYRSNPLNQQPAMVSIRYG